MTVNEFIEKLEMIRDLEGGELTLDFFQIAEGDRQFHMEFYAVELYEDYSPALKFRKFE